MNYYKGLLKIALAISFGLISCSIEKIEPMSKDKEAPGKVTDVIVNNIPGGAVLSYELPGDRNLSYVEAQWKTKKGESRNAKASFYQNTLTLEGFGDTSEYEVKLYSVGLSEKKSDPVMVKIRPLLAPLYDVFNSLEIEPDFGGCYVKYKNKAGSDIMIGVITTDSTDPGKMLTVYNHYSSQKEETFNVRGFPSEKRLFGLYVRDRWLNYSDTVYKELTPLYEEELSKSKFKEYYLMGDINDNLYQGNRMSRLWDNNLGASGLYISWTNAGGPVMPDLSFSIDLGVSAKLSRFQLIQRYADFQSNAYNIANPKKFEVWGTNAIPDSDGSWDNWTKLLDCKIIKPSGLPLGQLSNDDISEVAKGHEFSFSRNSLPVRYIRLKINENWGGTPYIYLAELSFWGEIK